MKEFKSIKSIHTDMKTTQQEQSEKNAYTSAGLMALDRVVGLVTSGKLAVKDVTELLENAEKVREFILREKE